MAPGVAVLSTYPGSNPVGDPSTPPTGWGTGTGVASYIGTSEQGKYATLSGTSMASPIAAGIGGTCQIKESNLDSCTDKNGFASQSISSKPGM